MVKTCNNRKCDGFYSFWELDEISRTCPECHEDVSVKKSRKVIDNLDKLSKDEAIKIHDVLSDCVKITQEIDEVINVC